MLPPTLARILGLGPKTELHGNLKAAVDTMWEIAVFYIVLLLASSGLFAWAENVSFGTAIYWGGITAATVGYGDVTPKTGIGMFLSVIYAHICVILVAMFTTRLLMRVIDDHNAFTHEEQEANKEQIAELDRKLDLLIEALIQNGQLPRRPSDSETS